MANETALAEVYGDYDGKDGTEEDFANARLITAAPELLKALEEMLITHKLGNKDMHWHSTARRLAYEAIAKAKGE